MKKYLVLLIAILIIPSVAFASWWNPFSWGRKNIIENKEINPNIVNFNNEQVNSLMKEIEELKKQIIDLKTNQENISSKEVKAKEVTLAPIREKTLSEKVGLSREKLATCIKTTDKDALNKKISVSVENAMKALPSEQRGTPYSIIIGKNGVKKEILGAQSFEEVKKAIDEVMSGSVTNKYGGEVSETEPNDHIMGSSNAQIKIIEYSDLECPYCRIYHNTLKKIVSDSNGNVSWVYRHWPIHQNSFEKLLASECVSKEKGNNAFWSYVDLLFGMLEPTNNSITDKL